MTDEDLFAAAIRFAERLPGYRPPAAYSVARLDPDATVFAHLNAPGGKHLLPAVVLASVCGHSTGTATYRLRQDQFSDAIDRLAPAEAATHHDHPNLWSWRPLLSNAAAGSSFVAVFVEHLTDPPVDDVDAEFRAHLAEIGR